MAIRKVAVWFILTLCSCTPTFTAQVHTGIARWESATCVSPSYKVIQLVDSIPKCGAMVSKPEQPIYGCHIRGFIVISRITPPDLLQQVIVHEIGHLYTPIHTADKQGILAALTDNATHYITAADIDNACQEINCPCYNPEKP